MLHMAVTIQFPYIRLLHERHSSTNYNHRFRAISICFLNHILYIIGRYVLDINMSTSNHIPREVDLVVAGGTFSFAPVFSMLAILILSRGSTGIVVASRLAKADPTLSILVLEHGPDVRDNPQIVNPALFITNILPESKTATFYTAEPSKYLNGRQAIVPTGGCLGGGSSINFLVYVRPQEIDFDDWKTEGWSGKEMITFFKKVCYVVLFHRCPVIQVAMYLCRCLLL